MNRRYHGLVLTGAHAGAYRTCDGPVLRLHRPGDLGASAPVGDAALVPMEERLFYETHCHWSMRVRTATQNMDPGFWLPVAFSNSSDFECAVEVFRLLTAGFIAGKKLKRLTDAFEVAP